MPEICRDSFRELWLPDFEFDHPDGECVRSVRCLVAWELRSGRKIQMWEDEFGPTCPYNISRESCVISFALDAELSCHQFLGWGFPAYAIDLRVEFLRATNTSPPPPKEKGKGWGSLLQALTYYGLDPIDAVVKQQMRALVIRGGPYTADERKEILDYCECDVRAASRLLRVMIKRGDLHFDRRLIYALFRGHYMKAVTRMEFTGVPIDLERYDRLTNRWDLIKMKLIETLGKSFGVYDETGSFSRKRFAWYLNKRGWGWPMHESGQLDMRDKTFEMMAEIHSELEPLRQLDYCLGKLKLRELYVGRDGFNRCWLAPYASRTSRNQPSNSHFIFGPAVWLRDFLIQPKPGWGLCYLDWRGQELAIAAGGSGDVALMEACASDDPHLHFGKQAGLIPSWATAETHPREREQLKVLGLAVQYGLKYRSLSLRIDQPDIVGRELLRLHRKVYRRFWEWSDNRVSRALLSTEQRTVFDWLLRFKEPPKINSVRNFYCQANGAEMMRCACCFAMEAGIELCAPVHDGFLIQAPLDRLDNDVACMRACMARASRVILRGFELRSDAHVYRYPERYSDPKGRGRFMLETILKFL